MTTEQKKVYDSIFKTVSTRIMEGVENVQSTQSGKRWEQDNGFYVTHLHIESVKVFGARINMGIQFLWYNNDSLLYQFYDHPNYICPFPTPDVDSPNIPFNPLGLLGYEEHTVDEFERYFTLLMIEARKVFGHYAAMRDLSVFQQAMADKFAYDWDVEIKHGRRGCYRYAIELAMIAMTAGDSDTAIPLMEEIAAKSQHPFEAARAKEMLAHTSSRAEWLSYVNARIASGRGALAPRIKILGKCRFAFE